MVEMVSNLYDIDANKTTFTVTFAILMHQEKMGIGDEVATIKIQDSC